MVVRQADRTEVPGDDSPVWSARVYLARHGRTALNAAGVLRGHIDVPLDSVGQHQAFLLGAELAPLAPRAIVSSPLSRAVQTAGPLAEKLGLPIGTDQRLADRYYGEWAGVSVAEVIARWGSVDAAPGVEPAPEVRARMLAALADIAESACGTAVVVVSHDAVNRIALAALEPGLGRPDQVPQDTGCFNILDCHRETGGDRRWDVVRINHVPPEVAEPMARLVSDLEP